jgi:cytochrome oxidase Cu insertion factor (SCO1/SenC/PrrC family)
MIASAFELVDRTNRVVRGEGLRGKWPLDFFGFTLCPDIWTSARQR